MKAINVNSGLGPHAAPCTVGGFSLKTTDWTWFARGPSCLHINVSACDAYKFEKMKWRGRRDFLVSNVTFGLSATVCFLFLCRVGRRRCNACWVYIDLVLERMKGKWTSTLYNRTTRARGAVGLESSCGLLGCPKATAMSGYLNSSFG